METLPTPLIQLINPLTYEAYLTLVDQMVAQNSTTGNDLTPERIEFNKLNQQRMRRVEKQFMLSPKLRALLERCQPQWKWWVLVEAWCGDGAQIVPAIAGIAAEFPSIDLTLLLRDQNPDLMDTCLTNGNRAIPMLVCLDAMTGERLFTWGPRPGAIQAQLRVYKTENPDATHAQLLTQLHIWYAKDRSCALQDDLLPLVQEAISLQMLLPEPVK